MRQRIHIISLMSLFGLILPSIVLAGSANLRWRANNEPDLATYNVYYGASPRSYGNPIPVGNSTSYEVDGLADGQTYYFAVTAVDTSGNESGFSNEVQEMIEAPDQQPPPVTTLSHNLKADFDGNGWNDIVWRHQSTGRDVIWVMDGTQRSTLIDLPYVTEPEWRMDATGDFDQDGHTDIVWRNYATGSITIWKMDRTRRVSYRMLAPVRDLAWAICGAADFNNDGHTDILWRNTETGQNRVWLMNQMALSQMIDLNSVADVNWDIVGTGDFDRDGNCDIFWRNSRDGRNYIWHMNGTPGL